ncbi:MAG: hypothetical protein OER88_10725 [Planctomycetota bacterium]|nr:hypothetical protein [Planctomycetota bacterium]
MAIGPFILLIVVIGFLLVVSVVGILRSRQKRHGHAAQLEELERTFDD